MESNCAKHGLVSSKMLLTRTKSAKCTLGPGYNAADNLSVTLRTNCPFGFGLYAGMNGHIAKPIDVPILLDVLGEILK